MTFLQLEFFIAVMESATFLEAADRLNISQSSLSKQIMSLERELNVTLLDRSRRSAVPTAAGHLFYEDACRLMADYEQMKSRLAPFENAMAGQVRLGTLPVLGQYNITPVLRRFCEEYPGIRLDIDEVEDEQLIYGLKHGIYDLVIARDTQLKDSVYRSVALAADRLAALVAQSHPLASQSCIPLKALADQRFLLMRRQSSIYRLSVDSCTDCGFTPNIVRTARIESILSAVAAGEGVSILCRKNFTVFNPNGIAVLDIEPEIPTSVHLARLEGTKLSGAVRIFWKFITEHYKDF